MSRVKIKHDQIAAVEARLLKRLRAIGSTPRVELARDLNFAPSTIGIYVDRLIEEGLLREGSRIGGGEKGRPATLLDLNPDGGRFIGVDLEARSVLAVAVDFSQQPIKQVCRRLKSNETAESVIANMDAVIRETIAGDDRPILGVGIGVPGVVDPRSGVAKHYSFIRGWADVPLRQHVAAALKVPVFLENNIRSMALAELWFGQGRNVRDFICLGVRSGIAAGFVLNGELVRGADNLAGEIGAWPIPCGDKIERLEEIASVRALAERMAAVLPVAKGQRNGGSALDPFVEAAADHQPAILAELTRAGDALGIVACQLCLAFNPQKLIIAGPLTAFGRQAVDPMVAAMQRYSPPLHSRVPEIVTSDLGEYAGAVGAAAVAVHEWKPVR